MNVILFISDTFRRDYLPCYGNKQIITPNFDAFAKKAIIFEDCYAASFPTVPCRADILTGRYTFTYQKWGPLSQDEVTLPQVLTDADYQTCGIADTPFMIRNAYGQDRGFLDFIHVRGQRAGLEKDDVTSLMRSENDLFAPRTLTEAANWLERHYKKPFFLYIDTWDPHEPWDPPAYYVKPYYPDYQGEIISPAYWDYKEDGYTEKDLEVARACYSGEISMIDRWFGFLLERLRTLGIMDETAILFTSDHGFYFGEHGQFGKRRFRWESNLPFEKGWEVAHKGGIGYTYRSPLHNEVTQVPLLLYLPGAIAKRVPGLVSLPDLMPTILELAGVDIPGTVQAKSILPLATGKVQSLHDFVVTCAPFEDIGSLSKTVDDLVRKTEELSPASITNLEWDLLYAAQGELVELYRTREDPGHRKNIFADNRSVAEKMHSQYVRWLEQMGTAEDLLAPRRDL